MRPASMNYLHGDWYMAWKLAMQKLGECDVSTVRGPSDGGCLMRDQEVGTALKA